VDMGVPTRGALAEGGAPDMARTCACNCCTRRRMELEILAEEVPWTARASVRVGMAMERRGWAGGGLSIAGCQGKEASGGVWGVLATGGF